MVLFWSSFVSHFGGFRGKIGEKQKMRLGNPSLENPHLKPVYLEIYIKHVSVRLVVLFWNSFVLHFSWF